MKHKFSQKPKYEIGQKTWFTDRSISENTGLEFENKVEAVIVSVTATFVTIGGPTGPKQLSDEETYAYGYAPDFDEDDMQMHLLAKVEEAEVVLRDC